jgi:creatinine amidohydrolase
VFSQVLKALRAASSRLASIPSALLVTMVETKPRKPQLHRSSRRMDQPRYHRAAWSDYYVDTAQIEYLREKGETQATIGIHAGIIDTSEMLGVHPQGVDLARLVALPANSEPTGHSDDPMRASAEYGAALLDIRINAVIRHIRAALQSRQASGQGPM